MSKDIPICNISNHMLTSLLSVVCTIILICAFVGCSNTSIPKTSTIVSSNIAEQKKNTNLEKIETKKEKASDIKIIKIKPTPIPLIISESATSPALKPHNITSIPTPITTNFSTPITKPVQSSGTLKLAVKQSFNSLDPHQESSQSFSAWGPGIVYERVMKFNNGEQTTLPSMETICDLCKSWQIKNLTHFNFQLKDNHIWNYDSDTVPHKVTAYDIEYSFNRMKEKNSQQIYNLNIMNKINAISPTELTIELLAPDADFLKNIAHGNAKILSKHHTQNKDDLDNSPPIGSGPWKLVKLSKDSMSFLESSSHSVKKPLVNRIEFHIIPDSEVRLSSYLAGLIDIYKLEDNTENQRDLSKFSTEITLKEIRSGEGIEIVFNASTSPFNVKEIRKRTFYSMNPTMFDFNSDRPIPSLGFTVDNHNWLPQPVEWTEYFSDNSSKKSLPESLTTLKDKSVSIDVGNYGYHYLQSAEFVSERLSDFGFKANIHILNRPEYAARALGEQNFQILIGPPLPHFTPNSYLL